MDKDYALIHKFIMESKPKTNADRIRNMSDEELADILSDNCFEVMHTDRCLVGTCKKCILDWLQSEVE